MGLLLERALQETKWFGCEVYEVQGSVILTSGRSVPGNGEAVRRGEGVALVLRGIAIQAWRRGGKQWRAWSPRCVSVCLQLNKHTTSKLHVVSVYAPTWAASRDVKEAFFQELENVISSIPSSECYVLLGDFNARVGSRGSVSDQWDGVRGPHGLGVCNDAGKELLSFLSLHEAMVCNTWYEKRDIYKQTWQHPKSKRWSCIDFVVMRQKNRHMCLDVAAKRGAICNTDHHLVCVKLRLQRSARHGKRGSGERNRRFNVEKMAVRLSCGKRDEAVRDKFVATVLDKTREGWCDEATVTDKWLTVSSALVSSAEEVIGAEKRSQPDWFRDSLELLRPLLLSRNAAYSEWLGSGRQEDLMWFREVRLQARRAVKSAKDAWFLMKAKEIEGDKFGGKKAIRDMQRGRRGLIPSRVVSIVGEDGNVCQSTSAQHQRWRRHFTKVLNIRSQFDQGELDRVEQREILDTMGTKPTSLEVRQAIGKLKSGKAAGSSGILPEMLKAGKKSKDFVGMITDLVDAVWEERCVPREWADAILVPIPKKGNLQSCDNWRGIALLDVVGKLVARIVQKRLQVLAERELPESQCGFRRGRGCTDMIFVVRQLAEKAIEHQTKQFFVFVDLRKAYDSVPREALWVALRKLGVPDILVDIIKSFHTGMQAKVRIDGLLLDEIEVNNGLRQGCTMAPTLFNLYACVVAQRWMELVGGEGEVGTRLLYKLDKQLFRRYTRNASVQ